MKKSSLSPDSPTPRAIVYVRVSSAEQSHGYSLVTQEESCRRYCEQHGYELLAEFEDAHSGTELDRPGLNAALDAVKLLRPDVVVLHDVDRLGREIIVQAIAERELTRHGARVEYVMGGNSDEPSGELLKTIKGAIAVYENRQRVERTRRGKDGRVKAGHPLVGPRAPYGYAYVGGDRTGSLVPRDDEAAVVRQMYAWAADEGLSRYEIAQRLFLRATPTRADEAGSIVSKQAGPCAWHPHTVADILKSETYAGTWYYGKTRLVPRDDGREGKVQRARPREEWLAVAVPPLVEAATWHRAQERLSRRVRAAHSDRAYLLSGRLFCGCGRRWTGRHKNDRNVSWYRCPKTDAERWHRPCPMRFGIRQERLETAVLGAVAAFMADPDVRRAAFAAELERATTDRERVTADLATIDESLSRVERQLGKLLDAALTDDFPAELVATRKRALVAERQRLAADRERRLSALADPVVDIEAEIAALAPTVAAAVANAAEAPADVRELFDLLRLAVHVVDRDHVRLEGVIAGTLITLSSRQKVSACPTVPFALAVTLPHRAVAGGLALAAD